MAVYEYKALTADGRTVSGIIDADNPKTARSKLRKQGIFPTDVFEGRGGKGGGATLSLSRDVDLKKYFSRVSVRDISTATRQLATLLNSGVPLIESLSALVDQTENEKLKLTWTQVREKVNEGASLADAMRAHPAVFNDLFVNMVAAGEQSGALDAVLLRLSEYSESQVRLRSKVIGAVTYPAVMLVVSIVLVGFLFVFVVPKITKIFKDMKIVLPLVTRMIIAVSDFAVNYWWLVIIMGGLAIYLVRRWLRSEKGRAVYDRYSLKAPIFGKLFRMVALSRFANTLSTLLHSGVPLLNAMKIVRNIVNNTVIAAAIDQARESIQEGHSIAEPLKRSGEFPAMATHMIAIGERTGQLEPMLLKVSEAYEAQVDGMVSTLTSLLEPIMILIMGGVVATIALAILLPMMQITQAIH